MNQEIEDLRKKIDEINNEILSLLNKREKLCKEIGKIKKQGGLEIIDKEREQEMLSELKEKAKKLNLDEDYIENLFKLIIENSRKIQEK